MGYMESIGKLSSTSMDHGGMGHDGMGHDDQGMCSMDVSTSRVVLMSLKLICIANKLYF